MKLIRFEDHKDKIAFLVGCFATFYVSLIGRVYVGELIIFLLYIFKPQSRKSLPKELKTLTKLLYFWLASAIVSDIWNHIPVIDMIKGTISILFVIALIPFVYWVLCDKLKRWMLFYLGTIVSSQLTYYLLTSQTEFGSSEIWKTYSYAPLFIGAAIYLYWLGKKRISYLIFLSFGVWILFGGSRNVFITCSFVVIILYISDNISGNTVMNRIQRYQSKMGNLLIAMLIGMLVIDNVYEQLAGSGMLGEYAYEKYVKQKNSEFGMASGRLEFIMDCDLISKSPIIGYGSFAKDRTNYVYNFYVDHHIYIPPGAFEHDVESVENMLPRHSRIGGTWMWHGIGAGAFWIFTLLLTWRVLKSGAFLIEPQLMGLCVYTMMSEMWNTFFSIMSVRLPLIFMWVYFILIYKKYKELRYNNS